MASNRFFTGGDLDLLGMKNEGITINVIQEVSHVYLGHHFKSGVDRDASAGVDN